MLVALCAFPPGEVVVAAQELSTQAKAELKQRDQLHDQTQRSQTAGRLSEAITSAKAMLAIERKVLPGDHDDVIGSLNWLASMYLERADFTAAKTARLEALGLLRRHHGEKHWKVTDARRALDDVEGQARMTRDQMQKLAEGNRLNREVIELHQARKHGEATPRARRVLALRKEVLGERHPEYAMSLNNLALLLESQGDYAAARPLFEQALAINKGVLGERHPEYAMSLHDLAGLLRSQGDYAAARPLNEQALAILKEVLGERHRDYAMSLNSLAVLLAWQGDYAVARPLFEQALAINKELRGERHRDYASSLNNLAALFMSEGDHAAARPLFEQALAIRREVLGERHPEYATSLNNLAKLLDAQGDYTAARPLFERALAINKDVLGHRHPDYATCLGNLAGLLQSQGDYAAARPLFEQALAIRREVQGERHPDYAASLSNLGLLAWRKGNLAAACTLLTQALAITEQNLELAAAAQSERQQLAMARELRWSLDTYVSVSPLTGVSPDCAYGRLLRAKGAVFERQRRMRGLRRRHRGDAQSVRVAEEYAKTVAELAALALGSPDPGKPEEWKARVEVLSQRKDQVEAELSRLDAGFREAQEIARRTPQQLQAALPKDAALIDFLVYTAFQPPAERKGEFSTERRMLAFVVRRDRPIERIDLGPVALIQKAIDAWRPLLMKGETGAASPDAADAVRRLVWDPLETHLDGITTVLISPDGPIGLVPLAALPGKKPGTYLIEERSFAVVPVPRMLASAPVSAATAQGGATASADRTPSLLLLGEIDYGGDPGKGGELAMQRSAAVSARAGFLPEFKPLGATGDEVASIGRYFRNHYPGADQLELSGKQATEEAFRREAPRHRYLHLATHGYFAPQELRSALGPDDAKRSQIGIDPLGGAGVAGWHPGLLSGIALAGANVRPTPIGQDDGILTALEVAELDLSGVELAVLSACETGLGAVAGGEGLLGLQRAFQVAGAHSVIASLWKVDDERTRALMSRFYENLWRKGQPAAEALRGAQLSMLRGDLGRGSLKREASEPKSDRLPPYYWAAFVLSTDRVAAPTEPKNSAKGLR
jgi:CHAT domain-containing protein/Tfp pilus assembly protein PilF